MVDKTWIIFGLEIPLNNVQALRCFFFYWFEAEYVPESPLTELEFLHSDLRKTLSVHKGSFPKLGLTSISNESCLI